MVKKKNEETMSGNEAGGAVTGRHGNTSPGGNPVGQSIIQCHFVAKLETMKDAHMEITLMKSFMMLPMEPKPTSP